MSTNPSASPDQPSRTATPPAANYKPDAARGSRMITRAGALWTALTAGFLILIVLLIFVAQNTASVPFSFLGFHWHLQLGVAILLSAVGGGLITVGAGTARIVQLRRAAKKQTRPRR